MKTDMSAHAVTMRLKKSSELRHLCIALGGERLRSQMQGSGVSPVSTKVSVQPSLPELHRQERSKRLETKGPVSKMG